MPFELDECEEDVDEPAAGVDEVVAGVDEVAGGLDDEPPEFDPQAAAASADSTSMTAVQPRMDRVLIMCMIAPYREQVGPGTGPPTS